MEAGEELWVLNNDWEGSSMVADIRPGPASSSPSNMVFRNGRLYFSANDGAAPGSGHGTELWAYDIPVQRFFLPVVSQ